MKAPQGELETEEAATEAAIQSITVFCAVIETAVFLEDGNSGSGLKLASRREKIQTLGGMRPNFSRI